MRLLDTFVQEISENVVSAVSGQSHLLCPLTADTILSLKNVMDLKRTRSSAHQCNTQRTKDVRGAHCVAKTLKAPLIVIIIILVRLSASDHASVAGKGIT